MLDALNLRGVQVWDFARMNFIRTLLSKRKLTKLVESGVVWGWDDPRFPTIRGIRRRGMTIPALREFILKQGPSKAVTLFDWALSMYLFDPLAKSMIETSSNTKNLQSGPPTRNTLTLLRPVTLP
jgi:glutamyl-tRNA synthetase